MWVNLYTNTKNSIISNWAWCCCQMSSGTKPTELTLSGTQVRKHLSCSRGRGEMITVWEAAGPSYLTNIKWDPFPPKQRNGAQISLCGGIMHQSDPTSDASRRRIRTWWLPPSLSGGRSSAFQCHGHPGIPGDLVLTSGRFLVLWVIPRVGWPDIRGMVFVQFGLKAGKRRKKTDFTGSLEGAEGRTWTLKVGTWLFAFQ